MTLTSIGEFHHPGLWSSIWKLLLMRARLVWSGFRRAKPRQKIGQVIFLLFLTALATGAFVFSQVLIGFLRTPALAEQINLLALFSALPGLVLSMAFFVILITNFGVLLQALYLSHDMDFLIASPLPMRAVFVSKLIQAILPGFGLFCLVGLPMLFGLGAASNYTWIYYPLVVITLAVMALAAAGIASILVMAVVRVIPARRAAEVLGFIGAIVSILCSQFGNLTNSLNLHEGQVATAVNQIASVSPIWSPFTWAGRGLTDIGGGAWLSGIGLTLLTLLVAGGIFAGTLVLSENLYFTGWAGLQSSVQKKKGVRRTKIKNRNVPGMSRILPVPIRAIISKDFLLMRRDLRNLSQLITPLILGAVMVFSTLRSTSSGRLFEEVPMAGLPVYTNIAFTFFVGWMLMFNLATTSFSREGKHYWMLSAAPLKPSQLIRAKFIVSFIPTLLVGWFFVAVTSLIRSITFSQLVYSLLVTGFGFAGLNGILLAFSIAGANLDWEDPRKVGLRGTAGCMSMIVSLFYFAFCLALYLSPPVLCEIFAPDKLWVGNILGAIFGTIFAMLCAVIPPRLFLGRIALMGQPRNA
jgi:ABC-2 type transport system permease protein